MSGIVCVTMVCCVVVEVCADYGGVNVFHVGLILASSMVLGFVALLFSCLVLLVVCFG